jgi:hypothetical protein
VLHSDLNKSSKKQEKKSTGILMHSKRTLKSDTTILIKNKTNHQKITEPKSSEEENQIAS